MPTCLAIRSTARKLEETTMTRNLKLDPNLDIYKGIALGLLRQPGRVCIN